MKSAIVFAALASSAGCLLAFSGCGRKTAEGTGPAVGVVGSPANPSAPAAPKSEPLPGVRGDLQNIAANWRELGPAMARDPLPFRIVEAKAWAIAASSNQIMKLAERTTGSPTLPSKGATPEEIGKLGFATGMGDDKVPEAFRDVDLIGINAKRLALAAGDFDSAETRKWWTQLDMLCRGVCADAAPEAPASPVPETPAAPTPGKQ